MAGSESAASEFWQFSLRFYSRAEIPPLCIALQDDYDVDVNLLFFILYLGVNGRQLTIDDVRRIDASIHDWRVKIVQPLRAIRRELKVGIAPVDANTAEALRSAIKRDELLAERLQQAALERGFPVASTGVPAAARAAAEANIAAYRSTMGAWPEAAFRPLLTALLRSEGLLDG